MGTTKPSTILQQGSSEVNMIKNNPLVRAIMISVLEMMALIVCISFSVFVVLDTLTDSAPIFN